MWADQQARMSFEIRRQDTSGPPRQWRHTNRDRGDRLLTPPALLREKLALPRVRQLVNDEIFSALAFSLRKNKCATL
jgi:hypothetical protein